MALAMGVDLGKAVESDTKKEVERVCRSRFDKPGGVESEDEMIFRLLIEQLQKKN